MPAPVIDPTTSVHAYRLGEFFVYQPGATNTPTSWSAVGLPEGVTINGTTGKIEGAATEPGFYNVTLKATNGDGTSPALFLPIGIENAAFWNDASLDVEMSLATGAVVNPAVSGVGDEVPPVIFTKKGDTLLLSVGLTKGGFFFDLPIVQMDLAVKEFEPENLIILTTGDVTKVGSFDTARYQIVAFMDPAKLANVLSNYEDDRDTFVDAVGEIRFSFQHIKPGDSESSVLERSSANFKIRIARDIAPDIA